MTTKEFIEKSVEGEYKKWWLGEFYNSRFGMNITILSQVILDPKAWEAVGKVQKWQVHFCGVDEESGDSNCPEGCYPSYRDKMHEMIDALIEGGSISDYLETL